MYVLFNEMGFEGEVPEWIPYLPKPGMFAHPEYGELAFDPDRNTRFVNNFKSGVYQKVLPIDAEHHTKLSGALGWIDDMRANEDGSVDAHVSWTDRGQSMVSSGRFRYVSPEFYDQWEDPATGDVYQDIAIGAAVTTRPFFKEGSLRPLLANEHGINLPEVVLGMKIQEGRKAVGVSVSALAKELSVRKRQVERAEAGELVFSDSILKRAAGVLRMNEDELVRLSTGETETMDYKEQFDEAQGKLVQLGEKVQEKDKELKSLGEKVTELTGQVTERDGQIKSLSEQIADRDATIAKLTKTIEDAEAAQTERRFSELVANDGRPWAGKAESHMVVLRTLAKTFGEDADEFKTYVAQQQSVAAAVSDSKIFSEIGHDGPGQKKGGWEEIDKRARAIMDKTPGMTFSEAVDQVVTSDPNLYESYRSGQ